METFYFEWQEYAEVHAVTKKWIMKLIIWSVIVAYLPNIIWYFAGYPLDAVLAHCLVMTIGMPPVVILSMQAYQKQYSKKALHNSIMIDQDRIVVKREEFAQSFHHYVNEWETAVWNIEEIVLKGDILHIYGTWQVRVFPYKQIGRSKPVIAYEMQHAAQDIEIAPDRVEELDKLLKLYYN